MKIREFLFKIMFPDFYAHSVALENVLNSLQAEQINSYRSKPVDKYSCVFDAIERDKVKVLGIEKNRAGERVIVVRKTLGNDIWVTLYSPTYLAINNHPRIMSTTYTTDGFPYFAEEDYVIIDDVLMIDDNIGNGSICMKYFINEIRKKGFNYISGELSSVDKDHFDRSIHFYEKFGFKVTMAEDNNSGKIRLDLK